MSAWKASVHAQLQTVSKQILVLIASIVYSQIRAINGGEKINRGEKKDKK